MDVLAGLLIYGLIVYFLTASALERGKSAVTSFYRRRLGASKGDNPDPNPGGAKASPGASAHSKPAPAGRKVSAATSKRPKLAPSPVGRKAGAVAATALVGSGLFLRGFASGLRHGWPDGKRKARDWYARHVDRPLKAKPVDTNRCPKCRTDLARLGWPDRHADRNGRPCDYDWTADPVWRRCRDCHGILPVGSDQCPHCINGERPTRSPYDSGNLCRHCREHIANPHAPGCPLDPDPVQPADTDSKPAQRHTVNNPTPQPQPLRLVHDAAARLPKGRTEGDTRVVETATGGEVHNLEQAYAELDAIEREQTAEREDGALERQRAEGDQGDHEQFVKWLETADFPTNLCVSAKTIGERIAGRTAAAELRLGTADLMLADVAHVRERLAVHIAVQQEKAAAGGMAHSDAYAV